MILQETIELLQTKYPEYIRDLRIIEIRIGLFMTAVQLSDGSVGVSSTTMPEEGEIHCKKSKRDYGDFSPLKIKGHTVIHLLEFPEKNSIIRSMKIAVLNAISSVLLEKLPYKILRDTDPIDLVDLHSGKTIALVGAFQSYIDKITAGNSRLYVLELNENALVAEDRKYFVPANDYLRIFKEADTIIITGLTLVNQTLDPLLNAIHPSKQVIVTGPSSSFIPDLLFAGNVNLIGAVRTTNPELMLQVVSEGGGGYHTFRYCAEKICIVHE